jgi:hypothetical protein
LVKGFQEFHQVAFYIDPAGAVQFTELQTRISDQLEQGVPVSNANPCDPGCRRKGDFLPVPKHEAYSWRPHQFEDFGQQPFFRQACAAARPVWPVVHGMERAFGGRGFAQGFDSLSIHGRLFHYLVLMPVEVVAFHI